MSRAWTALLIFVGICFAAGASGSVFTASSVKTWYPGAQASRHSAIVGLRSRLVAPLPADGDGCLARLAAA
jgi:hypothetical protein